MAEWTWDPDDFAVLWFSEANDRFPNPLRFTSRFPYRDDFDNHRLVVRERYSRDELEEIQLALHTLSTSDIRVEIFGGTVKHGNSGGGVRVYRTVGARNLYHAVTLSQSTFGDADGPIRCRLFRVEHLPARLTNALPPCPPGSAQPETFHPRDLRGSDGQGPTGRNSPRERYRRLLNRPADGGGSAQLFTGPVNKLTNPWNALEWRDITDDGRYTEIRGEHVTVRPATPQDLAGQFAAWIDRAVERLREDELEVW